MGVKASPSLVLAHAGTHPPPPLSSREPAPSAGNPPIPSLVLAHAGTHPPSATHMSSGCARLPPLFPQRACPREDGGGNPSLILPRPHVIPSAAQRPFPSVEESCCPSPHCPRGCGDPSLPPLFLPRREPAPVKTGAGTHPFPRQSSPRRAFPRSASGIIWADPAKTHRRFVPCATTL